MDKPNIFQSNNFHMDAGDVLHILVKDLTGDGVTIALNDGEGLEEDSENVGFTTTLAPTTTEAPLIDKDGNIYTTVTIGTQEWIVENFRSETYSDDSVIPNITDQATWVADTTGAYCYYDNDEATYKSDYGALYNWYAINNASGLAYLEKGGIQEVGWRIPTLTDFQTLRTFIGGVYEANKLKEAGTDHWTAPNNGSDDYGFKAYGAGYRGSDGVFTDILIRSGFLSSTEDIEEIPPTIYVAYLTDYVEGIYMLGLYHTAKESGFSVRLVRDI